MTDRLSLPKLESHLWGAATILRGLVDAGDYKQFIFPLLFYKRLSAVQCKADCLVTRNTKDYQPALLPVMQPVDFLGTL